MPYSMTGYAKAEGVYNDQQISWQIKSVNQRFLDLAFRIPEGCGDLELAARNRLKSQLARGRLECVLQLERGSGGAEGVELDQGLYAAIVQIEEQVRGLAKGGKRGRLSMDRLLSWPGLLAERRVRLSALTGDSQFQAVALAVLDETVSRLLQSRKTEGQGLAEVMSALVDELEILLQQTAQVQPRIREGLESRLRARLSELLNGAVDEGRIGQEIAFFFNRLDVAEEMERLKIHIKEMRVNMVSEDAVGRRLDFLCQELSREVNTICSKSQDAELTRLGVEMKVVVEKLREQAQNLE